MTTTQHVSSTSKKNGGIAVDADRSERPGVPMEQSPPRPVGNAHWLSPDRQGDPGFVMKRKGLDALTPVFGTTCPPHGISGTIRRAAYRIAEHKTSHWLLLMIADRVDALESR
jgi:hypothetical protein